MALLGSFFTFIKDYPMLLVYAFLAYTVLFYLSILFSKPKPGKNPFYGDGRRPVQPLIHDKTTRDKVLKQGFAQKRIPEKIDAIVIGSGISGLTTAALLSKTGKKVLVLEQHDQAGGCCHTFVEKGFEFDVGIHYIGEMENRTLGRTLFEQITDGQVQWAPLDKNFDTVVIGQNENMKSYPLMSGKTDLQKSLIDSFPEEEDAICKFFDMLKEARKAFLYFVMLKSLPKKLANLVVKLRLLDIFTNYTKLATTTTQQYLDSITNNCELKAVLAYSFGDYGTAPDESSILMHALLLNHYHYSSSYPVGGASEIAFHIIPVIERSGGRVLVRANVTEIMCEKGRAVGVVVTKGDERIEIRARTIIPAGGVYNTLKMLPPEVASKSPLQELINNEQIKSGVGALSLFVGLKGTAKELDLKAQNIWAFTDPDLNKSFRSYIQHTPDLDNPENIPLLFVSFPSTKDPTWEERYPGKSVCTVVTLANWDWFKAWEKEKVMHRGDNYESLKESLSKQMWKQVCQMYPQLEDKVEYMELGSPVTNNYYIRSTKGEIYGLDHNLNRFKPEIAVKLRPSIGIPGLYLTGQDTLTAGMSGAMFSGLATAAAILHRDLFKDCMNLHSQIKQKEKLGNGVASSDKKSN